MKKNARRTFRCFSAAALAMLLACSPAVFAAEAALQDGTAAVSYAQGNDETGYGPGVKVTDAGDETATSSDASYEEGLYAADLCGESSNDVDPAEQGSAVSGAPNDGDTNTETSGGRTSGGSAASPSNASLCEAALFDADGVLMEGEVLDEDAIIEEPAVMSIKSAPRLMAAAPLSAAPLSAAPLAAAPLTVALEEGWWSDYDYDLVDSAKMITLTHYNGSETDVVVPAEAETGSGTYAIVISEECFSGNTSITSFACETGVELANGENAFSGCEALVSADLSGLDTSGVTNLFGLFEGCSILESVDLSGLDTSNVTDMRYMFWGCERLETVDVSGFDTSKVTNMSGMFGECYALKEMDLSGFVTSSDTVMSEMFASIENLETLITPANVAADAELPFTMYDKYGNGYEFFPADTSRPVRLTKDISETGWWTDFDYTLDSTAKTITLSSYVGEETDVTVQGSASIGGTEYATVIGAASGSQGIWYEKKDVLTSVIFEEGVSLSSGSRLFEGCSALECVDLSQIDMSGVAGTSGMFSGCSALESLFTPVNVSQDIALPFTMYDENGNEHSVLPKGEEYSILLTKEVHVQCINLDKEKASVSVGKTLQLSAIISPANAANKNVTWSSSNTSVASVSSTGLVQGKKVGTATITAVTEEGGAMASCAVKVNPQAPSLKRIANVSTGISFSWSAVSGAGGYRVYKKTGTGSFEALADVTGTSIMDSDVVSGTKYTYTVSCISKPGGAQISGKNSTGKSIIFVDTPVVKAPTSASAGVRVSWPKVKGAAKYVIQRHVGGGTPDWKWLKTVNAEEYTTAGETQGYTDTSGDITSGTWYAYTVRAINSEGGYSGQVGGRSIKYLAPVSVSKAESISRGVRITFSTVKAGYTYRLYRRTKGSDGKYGAAEVITERAKVYKGYDENVWIYDETAKSGKTYRYYVRCVSKNGSVPLSSFKNEVTITYKKP